MRRSALLIALIAVVVNSERGAGSDWLEDAHRRKPWRVGARCNADSQVRADGKRLPHSRRAGRDLLGPCQDGQGRLCRGGDVSR